MDLDVRTILPQTRYVNISVKGLQLEFEKVIYFNNKKISSEKFTYDLVEIAKKELVNLRKSKDAYFVLKTDGKFYYTQVPKEINFLSAHICGGIHKCAMLGHECARLSAASDEEGGCAKVREFSRGIEKYPWIKEGYETYHCSPNSFVVISCTHYVDLKKTKRYTPKIDKDTEKTYFCHF